ncbi:MON2 protein [Pelomyxa schiedti]|nr:MON2 protein [Pelomyxa schiedti]
MQVSFFEIIDDLTRSPYVDTCQLVLKSLFKIIESSGQVLHDGWPLVLAILGTVAEQNEKYIATAFSSVHLISSDFLPLLPKGCLGMYITTVGQYGMQAEVNISLTSSEILWNVADFLAQHTPVQKGISTLSQPSIAEVVDVPSTATSRTNEASELGESDLPTLWLQLFFELKKLALLERYDVRTGALATLFKSLAKHGSKFSAQIWESVLWEIIFPLLTSIQHLSHTADTKGIQLELGESSGKAVHMMIHHSRDSSQKQWDQTIVQGIEGVMKVLLTMFDSMKNLNRFLEIWEFVLKHIGSTADRFSVEVADCAIRELHTAMSKIVAEQLPETLWNLSWEVLTSLEGVYLHQQGNNKAKPLQTITNSLSALHSKSGLSLKTDDLLKMTSLLLEICLTNLEDYKNDDGLTPLQNTTASLLVSIASNAGDTLGEKQDEPRRGPIGGDSVRKEGILAMCRIIALSLGCSSEPTYSTPMYNVDYLTSLAVYVMKKLPPLFLNSSPTVKMSLFGRLAAVLGFAMSSKHQYPASQLWKAALTTFEAVSTSVMETQECVPPDSLALMWQAVGDWVEVFLFPGQASLQSVETESYDIELVQNYTTLVVTQSPNVSRPIEKLLQLLMQASQQPIPRTKLAQFCTHTLFSLCTPVITHPMIVNIFTPQVITRCKSVIQNFLSADKANSVQYRPALLEVTSVLTELEHLETDPSSFTPALSTHSRTALRLLTQQKPGDIVSLQTQLETASTQTHLVELYPLIIQLVCSHQDELALLIHPLLALVGKHFLFL